MENHINTFEKGMNKDVNILFQPNGTYRHCLNCSLVSQDGNNYVIKDCLGNVKTFEINIPYNSVYTVFGTEPMPIGFASFPGRLIVFSTNSETTTGYGEIGEITYVPYGEGIDSVNNVSSNFHRGYQVLYHSEFLNFTKLHQIESFTFPENDNIMRVYWTDNFNEPRVINVADPVYSTYFSSGSLVVGTQYMVLEGAITHNAVNYGPGLTAGNIFVAVNTNYTNLTGSSPTPKVIEYVDYRLLSWVPDRNLGNINFDSYGSGSKYCGDKIYFYRLAKVSDGVYTSWSYGSAPIHVGTSNVSTILTGNPYHDFVGNGSQTTLVVSPYSVKLNINNIDTIYDTIEVACAEFDQLIDVPRQIIIVAQLAINNSTLNSDGSITVEDTGTTNFGSLTLDDITLFPASIFKIKTLATNKNYNLIANITEREEFTETITASISSFEYPLIEQGDNDTCSNLSIFDNVGPTAFTSTNPGVGDIQPWSRWLVSLAPDNSNRVEYPVGSGTYYYTGDVFVGVSGSYTATFTGTAQARPCVNSNRYTPITPFPGSLSSQRNNAIQFKTTAFWDYKNPAVDQHIRGYWSNEKYRIGILCYDLKGNPFYVRWLNDFTFPDISTKGGLIISDAISGGTQYSLNPSGLKLDITIPGTLIDKISGFSIVRSPRDARIMCQGMVGRVVQTGASPNDEYPEPSIFFSPSGLGANLNTLTYMCPDYNVGYPFTKTVGLAGDIMEEACWLNPYDWGAANYYRSNPNAGIYIDGNSLVAKFTESLPSDAFSLRSVVIANPGGGGWVNVNENQTLTGWNGTSNNFINAVNLSGSGAINVNNFCSGLGFLGTSQSAVGGKKLIWQSVGTFNHYSVGTTYSQTDNKQKILMNYCKTILPADQYGGTGLQALANTLYISTGHYQPINSTVKYETLSGNNYVFNDVEVWGGDCYTCYIDYVYALYNNTNSYAITNFFPCECNANYNLRRGNKATNISTFPSNNSGIAWDNGGADPTILESYNYNQAYSTEGHNLLYPALPVNYVNSNHFPTRIRFAGEKFIGETKDSFRTFAINDYKDLNGQYGEINNLRQRDTIVFVFQNAAISTVPILERQILSGLSGAPTTLGTGGVVDRFDVINSYFGNQHQHGLTSTEYGFIWFDMRRKAVVRLKLGQGTVEISKTEGLNGFFNEIIVDNLGNFPSPNPLNSPNFDETSDRPLVGTGITGVYDPKFKVAYLVFKYSQTIEGEEGAFIIINKDFTIVNYDYENQFFGFSDFTPAIAHNHNQFVISANNPKNKTVYYGALMPPNTLFPVGTVVRAGNAEYIAIQDVTIVSYPGTSGSSGTNPLTGTDNWTKINKTNELWVSNQPEMLSLIIAPDYIYNKIFGQVVNNELEFVVNPSTANPFSVLSIEQKGNNVNYTDIYIESEGITASDVNISATSRFYRWIYDRITSVLPLSSTGRITNSYLKIKGIKKNWTTNPTVLSTSVKMLQKVISKFQEKR